MTAAASAATPASVPGASSSGIHEGEGKVESASADSLTISHGPIATMQWPAMTMGFAKPDPKSFADVRPGDTVRFQFKEGGPSGYQLVQVQKMAAGAAK
jgi:Cu(I)/Ag(I) efflux system membrane fusion protein